MDDEVRRLADAFGKAVVARDHEALDVILAPWLGVGATLDAFTQAFDSMLADWDAPTGGWAGAHRASLGALTYDDLRKPSDFAPGIDIPERVTAENYVAWVCVTFAPEEGGEEGFDAYCDAWFAAVRLPDGLHVGSLELVDPD